MDEEQREHEYKFDVKMTCAGCSGAIDRVLKKLKESGGVSSYSVDLATQGVIVKGSISYDDLLAKIKKTGKEVRSGAIFDHDINEYSVKLI